MPIILVSSLDETTKKQIRQKLLGQALAVV
jgi:hypothetical protein